MPVHDWTRVPSGLFHDFHQGWSIEIRNALNAGLLPTGFSALVEQRTGVKEPDVLTVESRVYAAARADGGLLTLERPETSIVRRTTNQVYAERANRIAVKHHLGRTVAVIEIVSPGNKDSRAALSDFIDKVIDFLRQGVHVLVVDLFPPSQRNPLGIHKMIWDKIIEEDFSLPRDKNRVLASYEVGGERAAYVELIGVGDPLPAMPLFLAAGVHIRVPLEPTYQRAWDVSSQEMRRAVETGVLPVVDEQ